jgi:hypothetical protein
MLAMKIRQMARRTAKPRCFVRGNSFSLGSAFFTGDNATRGFEWCGVRQTSASEAAKLSCFGARRMEIAGFSAPLARRGHFRFLMSAMQRRHLAFVTAKFPRVFEAWLNHNLFAALHTADGNARGKGTAKWQDCWMLDSVTVGAQNLDVILIRSKLWVISMGKAMMTMQHLGRSASLTKGLLAFPFFYCTFGIGRSALPPFPFIVRGPTRGGANAGAMTTAESLALGFG